jgi:valyl-tRNA synthetase
MDESRVEGYRNFATKLWNATRFCQANGIGASQAIAAPEATLAVNKWIIGEVAATQTLLDKAMADLRFDAAAGAIYHFAWDTFCDWYLELIKPASGAKIDDETKAVAGWALDQILVMLHPFMPFVTEELWHALGDRPYELIVGKWPDPQAAADRAAKAEVEWLIDLTRSLRTAKNELGLPPGAKLEAWLATPSDTASRMQETSAAAHERVARLSAVYVTPAPNGAALQVGAGSDALVIPLEGLIDVEAEKARLTKALAASEKEAAALAGRLGNSSFVERAKPEAVDKARADHAHHSAEAERLKAALERLG